MELPRLAGLSLLMCAVIGCAAVQHGRDVSAVAGRPLSARSAEGARWLAREAEIDPTVRSWLRREGRPDSLYVEGRMKLYLFYFAQDRAVMFERELAESRVTDLGRIPGSLLRRVPAAARRELVARRQARSREAKARALLEARAKPRPVGPAAQAPTSLYFGAFDLPELAERMRPPLSAADPGVRTWRKSRLADGRARWWSKVSGTRYELRPDAVTMARSAGRRQKHVGASLRVGLRRVNEAVFTAKAEAVTREVLPLVERVLRDPSGRMHLSRRIAGRTVRIQRLPAESLIVYSVHP